VIESYIGSALIVISKDKPHKTQRRRRQLLPAKHESRKVLHHFARPAKLSSNSIPCGPHGPAFPRGFSGFPFPIAFWSLTRPHSTSHHTAVGGVARHRSVNAGPNPNPREGAPPGTPQQNREQTGGSPSLSQQNPWRKPWASTPSTQNPREGKKDFVFFFLLPLLLELKLVEVSWD